MNFRTKVFKTIVALCFASIGIMSTTAWAQSLPAYTAYETKNDSIVLLADRYMSALTSMKQFNGVVLLKKDGEVLLRKAYNIHSDPSSTLYVKEDDQFDLRSVAKLLAKTSVLELEESGRLTRQATLKDYLPTFPRGEEISIEYLMDHRSGLPREFSETDKDPVDMNAYDIVKQSMKEDLEFEPGTQSLYSNVGYQLLYFLVGNRYGSTFIQFLRDTYFTPLGMDRSGSNFDDPLNNKTDYAYGHVVNADGRIECICDTPRDDMRMGNLYSTVDDLSAFLDVLDSPKYADLINEGVISHAGGSDGKRAYVERSFDHRYQMVFLSNFEDIPFEQLVTDLRAILLGQEVSLPEEVNRVETFVSREVLKRYTGDYDVVDAGHLLLTIKLENDSLFLYQKGKNNGYLYPESETVFYGDPKSKESIEFREDETGKYYMLLDFKGVQWKGTRIEK